MQIKKEKCYIIVYDLKNEQNDNFYIHVIFYMVASQNRSKIQTFFMNHNNFNAGI